jgi:RNA polymerase sigma-70 factor (ECF subfamily)
MAGDLEFADLVCLHYGALDRFAASPPRTESDAGDFVQETFLALAAKGSQLRDRSKGKSWLFTTLHREHLQRQRRLTRFPEAEVGDAETELPVVEPGLVKRLDGAAAQRCSGLSPPPSPQRAASSI